MGRGHHLGDGARGVAGALMGKDDEAILAIKKGLLAKQMNDEFEEKCKTLTTTIWDPPPGQDPNDWFTCSREKLDNLSIAVRESEERRLREKNWFIPKPRISKFWKSMLFWVAVATLTGLAGLGWTIYNDISAREAPVLSDQRPDSSPLQSESGRGSSDRADGD